MQNCTNTEAAVGRDGIVAITTAIATSVAGIIGTLIINNRQPIINFITGLICKLPVVGESVQKPSEEKKETDLEMQEIKMPGTKEESPGIVVESSFHERLKIKLPHSRSRSLEGITIINNTPHSTPRVSIEKDRNNGDKQLIVIGK